MKRKDFTTTVVYKTADGLSTKAQGPQTRCSNPDLAKQLAKSLYMKYAYVPADLKKATASMAEFTDGPTARVAATIALRNLIADLEQIIPGPPTGKRGYSRKNSSKIIKEDLASMGVSLEGENEQA